jgi:aryl-alcohol dehydrogenase-like predicted oxidoreductase
MTTDKPKAELRELGRTGLRVSRLGFGAFKVGRNQDIKYPHGYDLPDDTEVARLLNGLLDLGICYIDTAPAYGLSEERIGRAISHRRGEFILSTKVGERFEDGRSIYDFSPPAIRESVARSRERLRADVIDVLFLHPAGDDLGLATDAEIVSTLRDLKQAGVVAAIGLSARTRAAAEAALAWADVLMLEYHAGDRAQEPVISAAADAGVGVVIKKGLASGRLPAEAAIRFVLGNAGVDSLVVGGLDMGHMVENLRIAQACG